ncbi:MAG: 23S rRNA (uracil(1939)-C(5))-methyltransferase RlmD [Dethiobacteria bacterium]
MEGLSLKDIVELTVTGINSRGEGVARHRGFTVFVPGALPGDRVQAQVISLKKNYGRALLQSLLEPSPRRVSPPCPLFGECGACQLLHLDYAAQLEYKRELVRQALDRIAGLPEVPVLPVVGMERPLAYRNKAQLPVARQGDQVVAGFYALRSHRIVDCSGCLLQHPLNNAALEAVREAVGELNIPLYDEATGRGQLRYVVARTSWSREELILVLVTAGSRLHRSEELVGLLRERLPALKGVVQNINRSRGNYAFGPENRLLFGRDRLTEELLGLTFQLSPQAFFQVNPLQTEVLYRLAREAASLSGKERVLDLFCGVGTIALVMAGEAGQVVGVEVNDAAVEDARRNARLNGITNAVFRCGDAAAVAEELAEAGETFDVVVLDPPRKGCEGRLLEKIPELKPQRMVYVSCNPSTLARDLKILAGQGYRAHYVQPVDMFPHTCHVECVVLITRNI